MDRATFSKWNKEYERDIAKVAYDLKDKYQSEVERVCKCYGVNFDSSWLTVNTADIGQHFETPCISNLGCQSEDVGDKEIIVTHWQPLPKMPEGNKFDGIEQLEFLEAFGSWRPPLGCVK